MPSLDVREDPPPAGASWHPHVPRFVAEGIWNIPPRYVAILQYVAAFNRDCGHRFRSVINGGFVRDLLTGKQSDDLDLTWDLRQCAEGVTIVDILASLVEYSKRPERVHDESNVVSAVSLVEIMGDAEKGKTVDVVKAVFEFQDESPSIVVDVMPVLNICGKSPPGTTPREDAFRRDLTINALLLEVSDQTAATSTLLLELLRQRRSEADSIEAKADAVDAAADRQAFPFCEAAAVVCHELRWTLLDYVGGAQDLFQARVLRPPSVSEVAVGQTLEAVLQKHWACTHITHEDRKLFTTQLESQLRLQSSSKSEAGMIMLDDGEVASYTRQFLDWVTTFAADPSRVLRALRFRAKFAGFQFPKDGVFWHSLACGGPLLQRLSGARVYTNLAKAAGYPFPQVLKMITDIFGVTFAVESLDGRLQCLRLADFICNCGSNGSTVGPASSPIVTCQVERLEAILCQLFADSRSSCFRFWKNVPGHGHGASGLEVDRGEQHDNSVLAAAGSDITLAVCFSVGLLCCTFDPAAHRFDGNGPAFTLSSRWDRYSTALEAPTKFARFGRLVVERVTVLTAALRQLNAEVTRDSAISAIASRLSEAINLHLDTADKLFAQAVGLSLKRFQFHVLVWSQLRLDKVAVAVDAAHTVMTDFTDTGETSKYDGVAKAESRTDGGAADSQNAHKPSAQSKLTAKQYLAAEAAIDLGQQYVAQNCRCTALLAP
eukprot:INCI4608.2.p1 GENE.INCI4608.2~~INCI4608.2.p1  ORF type:complete len:745 (+),score=120.15 INCI4608.2:86-2236(+)